MATGTKKTPATEAARLESIGRPTDPMLVPHLERLGLRSMGAEAFGREGVEPAELYAEALESICGATDDSQAVEMYNGTLGVPVAFVNTHQRAVAQVQWNDNLAALYTNPGDVSGVRWGTGTMISADLFLTCGHLFDQTGGGWERPRQNGTTNIISPQEIATNMRLNFNFQVDASGNPRAEQSFAITQLIEYRLGGVDMAVCRIAGNPGNTFGWTTVSTVDAAINDMLCIIGHPAGMRKRIEAGPATALSGNELRYNDIDTLGGNSGSGILGPNGRLVGVHTNGGCNAAGTGSNYGMRITSIRSNSPTLRGLGTGTATRIAADFGGGVVATAVARDFNVATRVIADFGPIATHPVRDKMLTSDLGTRKGLDDVKRAFLDKQPGFENKGLFDNPAILDPGRVARPFVLSTPHHSAAASGFGEAAAGEASSAEYEAVLARLEAEMSERNQELSQLEAMYEAVRAEYQEIFG